MDFWCKIITLGAKLTLGAKPLRGNIDPEQPDSYWWIL